MQNAISNGQRDRVNFWPLYVLLGLMGALFAWWAWKQGAYFPEVFYPGAVGLCAVVAVIMAFAPPQRLGGLPLLAFCSIGALALWTVLSAAWSDVPSAGFEYGARVFAYAALFFVGIWTGQVLRERLGVGLLPVCLAGVALAVATAVEFAVATDMAWLLHDDGTLRFPIGYRNANATMFMIFAWLLAAVALERKYHWAVRAISVGSATCLLELAILAQSRGSIPAAAAAVVVLFIATPDRLRTAWILFLVMVPTAFATPELLSVFQNGTNDATAVPHLRDSARVIAVTSAFSIALAAFGFVVVEHGVRLSAVARRRISVGIGVAALVVVVAGAIAFVERNGGPATFVEERIDEFTSIGYPDLSDQETRYGANVGSNRGDFYRVSLLAARDSPLIGKGAGAFETEYLRERKSWETPQNPHSVEMLMLSELGVPGLLLLFCFFGTAAVCVWRVRRVSVSAAIVCAGVLAASTQWLVHASYDWFWLYPGVAAPVFFVLGLAAVAGGGSAPRGVIDRVRAAGIGYRIGAIVVLLVVAVGCGMLYLSDRYLGRALDGGSPPQAAIADLERSADLSPFDPDPLIEQAVIQARVGNPGAASRALQTALDRQPSSFRAQFLLTELMVAEGRPGAASALERARELNPREEELDDLEDRLRSRR